MYMINRDHYYTIAFWMQSELGLRGNEVNAFAILYGLTHDGSYCYNTNYLAEWLNMSRSRTNDLLHRLVEKGVVACDHETGQENRYRIADRFIAAAPTSASAPKAISTPSKQPSGSETNDRKRFAKPTIAEVAEYCAQRHNGIDAEAFVAFYESKGWKIGNAPMKNWKAAVVTWEKQDTRRVASTRNTNTADARARQYAALAAERAAYERGLHK